MPTTHELPKGTNRIARSDDHAFAAMPFCVLCERFERRGFGGNRELTPAIGYAEHVIALKRYDDVLTRRRRGIVQ